MRIEKKELSSLEMHYLVKEFKELENSKVDRIYHSKDEKNRLVLVLHISSAGKRFLEALLPGIIVMKDFKQDFENPTGFCMMLRKYLEGSILRSIRQVDFERVIELCFETRNQGAIIKNSIFIELFSKGNIIFCDSDRKILNILEQQHWKDRELKRGEVYIPPRSKYDVLSLGEKDFATIIKNSEKDSIVKTLAIEFSLGGIFAEELCTISNLNKNLSSRTIEEHKISILYKNFKDIFVRDSKPNATNNDVLPFEIEGLKSSPKKYYETFNSAIAENIEITVNKAQIKHDSEIEKINIIIDQQQQNLLDAEKEYANNNLKAEALYTNYQKIDQIMKTIRDARKKYSWKEIKNKLSEDEKFRKIIKDINEKNSEITIYIEDKN